MTINAKPVKRRPILSIQLPEDLETYLRDGLRLGTAERTALKARYLQS